jgi:hypothetical protein
MMMRRQQRWHGMGARCWGCGTRIKVQSGKWSWTPNACRNCAAASWNLIYDRSTGFGTVPENLLRELRR